MNRTVVTHTAQLAAVTGCVLASGCQPFLDSLAADAEQKRTVTVTIEGAVIGPADQNGAAWDGPGLNPEAVAFFAGLAVKQFPIGQIPVLGTVVGQFAGDLANSLFASFEAPDPKGTVRFQWADASGITDKYLALGTRDESYAPLWGAPMPNVPIHNAVITIDLWDEDLMDNDPIGSLLISEEQLLQAEAAGGTFAFDATEASRGMIQRLFISVRP